MRGWPGTEGLARDLGWRCGAFQLWLAGSGRPLSLPGEKSLFSFSLQGKDVGVGTVSQEATHFPLLAQPPCTKILPQCGKPCSPRVPQIQLIRPNGTLLSPLLTTRTRHRTLGPEPNPGFSPVFSLEVEGLTTFS